jgi:hypothetical protein
MLLTLDEVNRDPRITPTYLPALLEIKPQLQRIKIRKVIEQYCKTGGVDPFQLKSEIAEILGGQDLEAERVEITLRKHTLPRVHGTNEAWEYQANLSRLIATSADSRANHIVDELLRVRFLIVTGSAVVVCAGFPLEPASH